MYVLVLVCTQSYSMCLQLVCKEFKMLVWSIMNTGPMAARGRSICPSKLQGGSISVIPHALVLVWIHNVHCKKMVLLNTLFRSDLTSVLCYTLVLSNTPSGLLDTHIHQWQSNVVLVAYYYTILVLVLVITSTNNSSFFFYQFSKSVSINIQSQLPVLLSILVIVQF